MTNKRLNWYLESQNMIINLQSGFHKYSSTRLFTWFVRKISYVKLLETRVRQNQKHKHKIQNSKTKHIDKD